MDSTKELILYQKLKKGSLFCDFTRLMEQCEVKQENKEEMAQLYYSCACRLVEIAESHGFSGNLWHHFLTFLLVGNENAYSLSCEARGRAGGTIDQVARHDFAIFKKLFAFDIARFEDAFDVTGTELIADYNLAGRNGWAFGRRIRDRICELNARLEAALDVSCFQEAVTNFYREFGVGKLGLHKAFRIERDRKGVHIVPIANIAHVKLTDLIGYETAKKKLIDNTEAFVCGRRANNCLLFGDAGTGKSSSIKAIANQYYDRGLRMIEVYKHQFQDLNDLIAKIKNRGYKFIIYMDDLSFEDFEIEYKYLKALIEGGLEKKPDNVLIYATSNRRHLIREKFSDKAELSDDLHNNDTIQEKLSLAARFGVQIYFERPDRKEFLEIVKALAKKHQIPMKEEELYAEANKWELSHGTRSGRTAQQLIDYLL